MIAALALAVLVSSPPCPDLPLVPGTTWTYRAQVSWTAAGSSVVRDTTIEWTTKVLSSLRRDSTIVATVENWPTALAWWEPGQAADTTLLACIGPRVYRMTRPATAVGAKRDTTTGLAPAITDLLLSLPLHEGMLYGQDPPDRGDTMYGWFVEQAEPMPQAVTRLGATRQDSLYTVAYRTLPDHQIMEFAPGLGVTRYIYAHHGTVATADATLVRVHLSH